MSALLLGVPCLGVLVLRAMRLRGDPVSASAWAMVAGCLVVASAMQLGIEIGWPRVTACVVAGCGFLVIVPWRRGPQPRPHDEPRVLDGHWFDAVLGIGVALCVLFAVAGADRPCIEGDEGNIWSLKAKSLLCDWPALFASAQIHNLHPDYPQLNPLLQAFTFCVHPGFLSPFRPFENRWLVQACDIALFIAVAGALRHRVPPLAAAALVSLLLLEPEFHGLLRTAYADGMVALGLVVAVDCWLRFHERRDVRFAWLAGLGIAFALWSKNETMLYAAAALAAAVIVRVGRGSAGTAPSRRSWLPLLPPLAVIANNTIWNARFGMKSDLFGANPTGKSMFTLIAEQWPERVPAMAAEAIRLGTSLHHAHVVFVLPVLALVIAPRRALAAPWGVPAIALLLALLGIHVVYVGSFLPLRLHLDTSYARVLFQLLPAALVLVGAIASDVVAVRRAGHTVASP